MLMAATHVARDAGLMPGGDVRAAAAAARARRPADTRAQDVTPTQLLEHMRIDKKVKGGRIRLVLLRAIGGSFVTADYPDAALERTLDGASRIAQ